MRDEPPAPATAPSLFDPLPLRGVTLRNRIAISPMCTYSATDGIADDFHLAHYGRFGLGGAGLVMVEATGVTPEGRISHGDLGLWSDAHVEPLARIARLLKSTGAVPGIQLGHAGRKACRQRPWHGNGPLGPADHARGETEWTLSAPSPLPFGPGHPAPEPLGPADIDAVSDAFEAAARRALAAGFEVVECHAAHGFLLHSFMSGLTNARDDAYGGDFAGRHRLALEVAERLRATWPADRPLFFRISALDGVEGGRDFAETIRLCTELARRGVDVIDCSSGGLGGHSASTAGKGPASLGFQIPLAAVIRRESGIKTMAVGLITEPDLADEAVAGGSCDIVAIGRQALFDPNWPHHARHALGRSDRDAPFREWPEQYGWWLNGRAKVLAGLRM